ncbi:hypothetical protein PG994_010042 [Apiospora phragmitis]|uniref:Ap4A phosphorylase 1/2 N-terminal domain-containing protein n=1 Tax=Apiospora phragmitis TaxID=2905665 RepID=A0ABR1TP05_9PEZI
MASLIPRQDIGPRALDMFDNLLVQGRLFYEPTTGEVVEDQGFKVVGIFVNSSLRVREHLSTAGLSSSSFEPVPCSPKSPYWQATPQSARAEGGPFLNPDPDFVVAPIGDSHILQLSMHCIYRPAFILHTRDFAPQTDDLDISDFAAMHSAMARLGHTAPQMAIYNCGLDAGSSQGHKHMQVFASPYPFPLFPGAAVSEQGMCASGSRALSSLTEKWSDVESNIRNVPHQHYVLRLCPLDVSLNKY